MKALLQRHKKKKQDKDKKKQESSKTFSAADEVLPDPPDEATRMASWMVQMPLFY
jgi:hypothetical protein